MTTPVQPGDVLASKYRVERVLGAGGMGMVVAAQHLDLDQLVAIKLLLPEVVSEPEMVERFVREGRASVRLRGQHVAKTIDVGYHDGAPFLVMEYLQGHSLREEIDQHPGGLPIATAALFLLQACEGVAEAHALGIIHRDLKPENLFVSRGVDGHPSVKVLDFGISKMQDELDQNALTKTASLFGSPQYMSPEQMRSTKHVDVRTDIWSLGVIGYELVTGRRPFDATTVYDLCLQVAQETPPPIKSVRPDAPAALVTALEACLRKDASARTSNVAELARVLEPLAGPRAVGAAQRVRDMLQAGRAPSLLPPADGTGQVQTGWGATERVLSTDRPSRRTWWIVGAAAVASAGMLSFRLLQKAPDPPPGADPPPSSAQITSSASAPLPATEPQSPELPPVSSAVEPQASAASSADPPPPSAPESPPSTGGKKRPVAARSEPSTPSTAPKDAPTAAPAPAPAPEPAPPPAPAPAPKPVRTDDFEVNR